MIVSSSTLQPLDGDFVPFSIIDHGDCMYIASSCFSWWSHFLHGRTCWSSRMKTFQIPSFAFIVRTKFPQIMRAAKSQEVLVVALCLIFEKRRSRWGCLRGSRMLQVSRTWVYCIWSFSLFTWCKLNLATLRRRRQSSRKVWVHHDRIGMIGGVDVFALFAHRWLILSACYSSVQKKQVIWLLLQEVKLYLSMTCHL